MAKTIKEMIKVMQHYKNGGEVEYTTKRGINSPWEAVTLPSWDWVDFDYRIKKEKEEKPKIVIGKWLLYDKDDDFYFECRTSKVEEMLKWDSDSTVIVKLLESYEVEI